jgi:nitrogen fixation/metabolism regulation signal transduction histidine kinase
VQAAYREYQQRALALGGLRKMYIGTLTLALVLAVFGALLLAVALSNQLAKPLLLLAEGVRQVAQGDLSVKPVFASRDELGGLTRSFARDDRAAVGGARAGPSQRGPGRRRPHQPADDPRQLTAGVIVFDRDGRIDTVNPGATRIVRLPLSAYRGKRLDEIVGLGAFSQAVWQRFELHAASPEAGERDTGRTRSSSTRSAPTAGRASRSRCSVRGAAMPHGAALMVFDDITELVSAQRSEAWSEVARRLATRSRTR